MVQAKSHNVQNINNFWQRNQFRARTLLRKSNLSARIAKETTTKEMHKILEEIQSDKEDSPSPIHLGDENEDDCFGIFSPIP